MWLLQNGAQMRRDCLTFKIKRIVRYGCAMVEAVSHQAATVEAWVQSQTSLCVILVYKVALGQILVYRVAVGQISLS